MVDKRAGFEPNHSEQDLSPSSLEQVLIYNDAHAKRRLAELAASNAFRHESPSLTADGLRIAADISEESRDELVGQSDSLEVSIAGWAAGSQERRASVRDRLAKLSVPELVNMYGVVAAAYGEKSESGAPSELHDAIDSAIRRQSDGGVGRIAISPSAKAREKVGSLTLVTESDSLKGSSRYPVSLVEKSRQAGNYVKENFLPALKSIKSRAVKFARPSARVMHGFVSGAVEKLTPVAVAVYGYAKEVTGNLRHKIGKWWSEGSVNAAKQQAWVDEKRRRKAAQEAASQGELVNPELLVPIEKRYGTPRRRVTFGEQGSGSLDETSEPKTLKSEVRVDTLSLKDLRVTSALDDHRLASRRRDLPPGAGAESGDYGIADNEKGIFCVFDGVGGGPSGSDRVAAIAATEAVEKSLGLYDYFPSKASVGEHMRQVFSEVRKRVQDKGHDGEAVGTAVRVVSVGGVPHLVGIHAGDTRMFKYRKSTGKLVDMVPNQSRGSGVLNGFFRSGKQSSAPDVIICEPIEPGWRYMMCSDGVTGDYVEQAIAKENLAEALGMQFPEHAVASLTTDDGKKTSFGYIGLARKDDDRIALIFDITKERRAGSDSK